MTTIHLIGWLFVAAGIFTAVWVVIGIALGAFLIMCDLWGALIDVLVDEWWPKMYDRFNGARCWLGYHDVRTDAVNASYDACTRCPKRWRAV